MPYSKRFVCLANSRKFSGRCVAGLEATADGLGSWIRPVSERDSEELSIEERRYQDGGDVQLLDIVQARFKQPRPHGCQTENHVIDDEYYWVNSGKMAATDLVGVAVNSGPLWVDGYHSYSGENDRIPIETADKLSSSLLLVAPERLTVMVAPGLKKRQVRVRFKLASSSYCFSVTDPSVEAKYLAKSDGEYAADHRTLVCVSLGEPFDGFRYKLAAAVIPI